MTYEIDNRSPIDDPDASEKVLSVTEEIDQMLHEDDSRLGDVFRLYFEQRLPPQEVASNLDVATVGFVYSYKTTIDALRDGDYSESVHLLKQSRGAIRSLLKRNSSALSAAARELMRQRIGELEQRIDTFERGDVDLGPSIDEEVADNDLASLDGKSGIYAFSYGWYLENPFDPDLNTTLIKVGRAQDIRQRIREHKRGARTHIPEPLVVVRAYSVGEFDLTELEGHFHRLLNAAGHDNPRREIARRNEVGKEWFLTNERFLDAIASALRLRTEFIGESEFVE